MKRFLTGLFLGWICAGATMIAHGQMTTEPGIQMNAPGRLLCTDPDVILMLKKIMVNLGVE